MTTFPRHFPGAFMAFIDDVAFMAFIVDLGAFLGLSICFNWPLRSMFTPTEGETEGVNH